MGQGSGLLVSQSSPAAHEDANLTILNSDYSGNEAEQETTSLDLRISAVSGPEPELRCVNCKAQSGSLYSPLTPCSDPPQL